MMIRIIFIFIVLLISPGLLLNAVPTEERQEITINTEMASQFAAMAMRCIEKEFPNKLDHVMNNEKEVQNPRVLHPVFYGCFDWHSSVHGHWMLIRLLKTIPDLPQAASIRAALNRNITAANVLCEVQYLGQADRGSFERTYGWAWFLKLMAELYNWDDPDGKTWLKNLAPLEEAFVKRYMNFLPKQTYAIRTGVHPNTAFGIAFALDYARVAKNKPLEDLLIERSLFYFANDIACPVEWEPGGEDFFSPCLMEADLMQRVLKPEEFTRWFHVFMPGMREGKIRSLMSPAVVTDRSDGKLVHLDGLNLSRAWCMKRIAAALQVNDPARGYLLKAARWHTEDALKNLHSGQYAGEHWLASFATYLLTAGEPPGGLGPTPRHTKTSNKNFREVQEPLL